MAPHGVGVLIPAARLVMVQHLPKLSQLKLWEDLLIGVK
jgi:hypothetical protein